MDYTVELLPNGNERTVFVSFDACGDYPACHGDNICPIHETHIILGSE